jgi:hypothetical protein
MSGRRAVTFALALGAATGLGLTGPASAQHVATATYAAILAWSAQSSMRLGCKAHERKTGGSPGSGAPSKQGKIMSRQGWASAESHRFLAGIRLEMRVGLTRPTRQIRRAG